MATFSSVLLGLSLLGAADPPVEADVVIRGATIVDGGGAAGTPGDVALRGERIVAVGRFEVAGKPRRIDGKGLIVAPGFIDLHTHSDDGLTRPATRANRNYLMQGVTTVVTGNCGSGPVDVAVYFKKMEEGGVGTNVIHQVPHNDVRRLALGNANRAPTAEELKKMEALVDQAMKDGAWGLSTGLIYNPGTYAKTDEIIALAKVAAKHGGFYASHIRNEGVAVLDAIEEALTIGREAGLPVHVSHLKASGKKAWGKAADEIALIEKARKAGQIVTADQYPYVASSTSLAATVIPPRFREGDRKDYLARLDDPEQGPRIRKAIEANLEGRDSGKRLRIARYVPKPKWQGKDLSAIAEAEDKSVLDVVLEIERNGGAQIVNFGMSEEDVRLIMKQPWVATASDGSAQVLTANTVPHPRSYGCFARKIGHYALTEKVLSLEQAVRSASGLPADILKLPERGYLKAGYFADVVVFDPEAYRDVATFDKPHQYATGVRYLFVNGKTVIDEGKHTEALAGKVLRHQDKAAPAEPRQPEGHSKSVTAAVFAPDGQVLATAGLDGAVKLVNVADRRTLHTLAAGKDGAYALTFAPDGKLLASAGGDGLVRLWDPAAGREVRQLKGHKGTVSAVAFSRDGKVLASGGYDKTIRLWDPAKGTELRRIEGAEGRVTALVFSPDGKRLTSAGAVLADLSVGGNKISSGSSDVLRIWDVAGGKEVDRLPSRGLCLAASADGATLAAGGLVPDVQRTRKGVGIGGYDQVELMEASTGRTVLAIKKRGGVAALSADGKLLATGAGSYVHLKGFGSMSDGGADNRLRVWDAASGKELLRFPEEGAVTVALSPDGNTLAAGTGEGTVLLWDLKAARRDPRFEPKEAPPAQPAAEDRALCVRLDADFEALLKDEADPRPLREAARLLLSSDPHNQDADYRKAMTLLRGRRAKAAVPLLLKNALMHARARPKNLPFHDLTLTETLTLLTGENASARLQGGHWNQLITPAAAEGTIKDWWLAGKDRITTDFGKMSPERRQVVLDRLQQSIGRDLHDYPGSVAHRCSYLLASALNAADLDDDEDWILEHLHPAMLPLLLAPSGYEKAPPKEAVRETYSVALRSVPLLALLRKKFAGPELKDIAADVRQNSAVRLTCLVALRAAGEELDTRSVLALLATEKKLERRVVAVLALGHGDPKLAVPSLLNHLSDPNVHVRTAAVHALSGPKPDEALPQLAMMLGGRRPGAPVPDLLRLVASYGALEARQILADFLQATLEEPGKSEHLPQALWAFEEATGQKWTDFQKFSAAYHRAAARKALAWWREQQSGPKK
jgi:N-acyl-D-aspartate/D-glutamate deacylase